MKPILWESTETDFLTNGLGRLSDAISCNVVEERNGIYELQMDYPVDGILYDEVKVGRLISAIPADGKSPEPFEIYKITKPLNGVITIYGEHLSYRLNRIPVLPYSATNCALALQGLKTNAAEPCPFDFYTDKLLDGEWVNRTPASIREKLGGTEGSILERFQGEFEFNTWDVHLWTHRGNDNGVVIRYGKNLTDLEQEETIENTINGVLGYWANEDSVIYAPIQYSPNVSLFAHHRTAVIDFSDRFEEEPTVQELTDEVQDYITRNNIGTPSVNLSVKFIALWQTEEYKNLTSIERLNLCDTVTVIFEKLGVQAEAEVIKTDYDVLLERYNEIEVGDPQITLGDTITSISDSQANEVVTSYLPSVNANIQKASDLLTGVFGGNIVVNLTADGHPYEILVMDKPDKATAENVIRLNQNGIGMSQNGYPGPYNSVWSITGSFDASQINVIGLTASMIRGGILNLGALDNTSGVLRLYDNENALIGQMDRTGLKMYGQDGSYVLMNNSVGFAGYDRNDTKLYWADGQEFHMRKSVIEEEITLCNMMRYIPITLYDGGGNITNQGIAMVSSN